jgi:RHH-type transcriptional regulator, rel operon repressor / antitoxin RelB
MPVSVKLPTDLESRLEKLSSVTHRPKSYYIREALIEYLEEHEDTFIALARLEKPLSTISLDDVEKNLEMIWQSASWRAARTMAISNWRLSAGVPNPCAARCCAGAPGRPLARSLRITTASYQYQAMST